MNLRRFILPALALAATASAAAQQAAEKPKYNELYYQRASLFDALGVDSTNIVFLGNSLTHGCEWHELLGMPNVVNRGINGDVVQGLYDRIASVVDGRPAKIFLMIGANDVSHDLSADSIVTAVTSLIDHIRTATPSTRLYVQSMLPINNSFGRYRLMKGKEQTIRDINALLEPEVRRRGLTWVNLHPAFCDADGNLRADFTNAGLHLLAPGYMTWRDIILPYVKE